MAAAAAERPVFLRTTPLSMRCPSPPPALLSVPRLLGALSFGSCSLGGRGVLGLAASVLSLRGGSDAGDASSCALMTSRQQEPKQGDSSRLREGLLDAKGLRATRPLVSDGICGARARCQ